jgi:hypothetical protein
MLRPFTARNTAPSRHLSLPLVKNHLHSFYKTAALSPCAVPHVFARHPPLQLPAYSAQRARCEYKAASGTPPQIQPCLYIYDMFIIPADTPVTRQKKPMPSVYGHENASRRKPAAVQLPDPDSPPAAAACYIQGAPP